MSEPEINFYLDEFGSIKCSVTNKGVLLGEDEQKFIVDSFAQLRDENVKLRELVKDMQECFQIGAHSGEGIGRQWCRELHDSYGKRMSEL